MADVLTLEHSACSPKREPGKNSTDKGVVDRQVLGALMLEASVRQG